MTAREVVEHYGNGDVTATANALGLARNTVHVWLRKDQIPLEWQGWIERDTAGRLKGDRRRPNDPRIGKKP